MEDEPTHTSADLQYAVQLVHATCCLAGSASYLDDIRADLRDCEIIRALRDHDTPALFDWLVGMLSYQGISDANDIRPSVVDLPRFLAVLARTAVLPSATSCMKASTSSRVTRPPSNLMRKCRIR